MTGMGEAKRRILRYAACRLSADGQDELAVEEPLEIRVRGRPISVTMRTPGHDDELAAGFLLSEGLIHHRDDIQKIEACDRNEAGNLLNVQLAPQVGVDFARLTRHVFASSSCGLCGKATIDAVRKTFAPVDSDLKSAPKKLPDCRRSCASVRPRSPAPADCTPQPSSIAPAA